MAIKKQDTKEHQEKKQWAALLFGGGSLAAALALVGTLYTANLEHDVEGCKLATSLAEASQPFDDFSAESREKANLIIVDKLEECLE